ncbi:MAG TPA: cellulase family glycosylhydrolase [Opitutaceae bacterium]|nr:cellulase family glycosylhydrolase [Opitutaceae bacterium]
MHLPRMFFGFVRSGFWFLALGLGLSGVVAGAATPVGSATEGQAAHAEAPELRELHVDGRKLLDDRGTEVWLQGVNVVSLEFRLHGEHVPEAIRAAVEDWKANAIRLPVKESYWFGREKGQSDGGAAYRQLVDESIREITSRGAYVILDLHRFGAVRPEHVDFWKEAAAVYKNRPGVLFDIFNEPHSISWEVWRNGGWVEERKKLADEDTFLSAEEVARTKQGFESPGMQKLVEAIRAVGARNVIIAGGLDWAYDLSGVVNGFALHDPSGNGIMYSTHIYNWKRDWAGKVLGAAERYPIFVGEVGADVKKMTFIPADLQEDPYTWVPDMLGLIQQRHFHWTAWSFHPRTTPVLVSDWNFTPTPFWGVAAKAALSGKQFAVKKLR